MRWMRLNLESNFCLNPSSLWEWEWNSLKIDIVWLIPHDSSAWFDEWKWIMRSAMKKERDYKIRVCELSWMFLFFNFRQIHLLNKCTPLVLVVVIEQYLVMTTEIFWNERNVCPKETSTLSFSSHSHSHFQNIEYENCDWLIIFSVQIPYNIEKASEKSLPSGPWHISFLIQFVVCHLTFD
jgi:hypothetical protein